MSATRTPEDEFRAAVERNGRHALRVAAELGLAYSSVARRMRRLGLTPQGGRVRRVHHNGYDYGAIIAALRSGIPLKRVEGECGVSRRTVSIVRGTLRALGEDV